MDTSFANLGFLTSQSQLGNLGIC